jgi:hypothetical protein
MDYETCEAIQSQISNMDNHVSVSIPIAQNPQPPVIHRHPGRPTLAHNRDMSKPKTKRQKHVGRACVHCKKAHLACDESRPCKRCLHLGKTDCVDVEHKRRGRPKISPEKRKSNNGNNKNSTTAQGTLNSHRSNNLPLSTNIIHSNLNIIDPIQGHKSYNEKINSTDSSLKSSDDAISPDNEESIKALEISTNGYHWKRLNNNKIKDADSHLIFQRGIYSRLLRGKYITIIDR